MCVIAALELQADDADEVELTAGSRHSEIDMTICEGDGAELLYRRLHSVSVEVGKD